MADSQHGRLIVLCGPAGVGKGTVLGRVREQHPEIWLSVSATTRQPRPGEVDGVNYFFMTEPEFLAKEKAGDTRLSGLWNHYDQCLRERVLSLPA